MVIKVIADTIKKETVRLNDEIELIASENYPSQDILDILGSTLSVKYAEGYPGKRHYAGCENIDTIEAHAITEACNVFGCNFANVQPWSGSQANAAIYYAFCKPGAKTLSMDLNAGAHLTHGSKFTLSGKYFKNYSYNLKDDLLHYGDIKEQLEQVNPRLLIIGYSAYTRKIDFEKIRELVDDYNQRLFDSMMNALINNSGSEVGLLTTDTIYEDYEAAKCILWCDMAHFAGFVAAGVWKGKDSPIAYCDVITSTTHKTLRGPRGGLILWNDEQYTKKINQAVFPAIQGGPNGAAIAAKLQCFVEAQSDSYKNYIEKVSYNIVELQRGIELEDVDNKLEIITGGTDNHMLLIRVSGAGITGKQAEDMLSEKGIVVNKNMLSGDANPAKSSGIRLGTAAITTRGYTPEQCFSLGQVISMILLSTKDSADDETVNFSELAITSKLEKLRSEIPVFYGEKAGPSDFSPVIA